MVHLLNDPKKMMPNLMEKVSRAPREPRRTRTSSIVEVEMPKKTNPWRSNTCLKFRSQERTQDRREAFPPGLRELVHTATKLPPMNTPAGGKSANFGAPVAHMPEKSMKLKKLVFRMFLEGTYGVALRAKELSDVKADSRVGDLDVKDPVGENVLPMSKTINYTLSVTSWTKRRPQLFPWGKRDEIVVVANVYPMTERNETKVVKVEKQFEQYKHTCLERTSSEKKWTNPKTF